MDQLNLLSLSLSNIGLLQGRPMAMTMRSLTKYQCTSASRLRRELPHPDLKKNTCIHNRKNINIIEWKQSQATCHWPFMPEVQLICVSSADSLENMVKFHA